MRRIAREPGLRDRCVRFVSASDRRLALVLTIGKLGSSASQLDYYERQVAAGAEDYYAGRGESPGVWIGGGLVALGVPAGSRVSREAFLGLMEGLHPGDGSQLRRMTRASTVAAVDLTFSAPKSVSCRWPTVARERAGARVEDYGAVAREGEPWLEIDNTVERVTEAAERIGR